MRRKLLPLVAVAVVIVIAAIWLARRDGGQQYYTGFVEGEERVIRSEATGRVLEVPHGEGEALEAGAIVARLDTDDVDASLDAKRRELEVIDAEIQTQDERVALVEGTWETGLAARQAEARRAESALDLAERNLVRESGLARTGASTAQLLDNARAARDQAQSSLEAAREMAAQMQAEKRNLALAKRQLETLRRRRELLGAQLREIEVQRDKAVIRAPDVATVVQTQFVWPGELAQAGTPIVSVLDPLDKYVRIYLPVDELDRVAVGERAEIELDSAPGRRIPGEIVFIADQANFTPEKIETRDDRVGQVYRAKIRVLEEAERLKPGTEGNVYLLGPAAEEQGS